MRHKATRQIPDSKRMPLSIYDVLQALVILLKKRTNGFAMVASGVDTMLQFWPFIFAGFSWAANCAEVLNEASTKLSKLTIHWHPSHVEWRNIQSGPNGSGSEFGCWPFFLWSFFSCIHPSIRPFFQSASNPDVLYVQAKVFGFIQPGINTQREH